MAEESNELRPYIVHLPGNARIPHGSHAIQLTYATSPQKASSNIIARAAKGNREAIRAAMHVLRTDFKGPENYAHEVDVEWEDERGKRVSGLEEMDLMEVSMAETIADNRRRLGHSVAPSDCLSRAHEYIQVYFKQR